MCTAADLRKTGPRPNEIAEWSHEFENLWLRTTVTVPGPFTREYDVGRSSAEYLYMLVRWTKPALVVETGVARGVSSLVVLEAMDLSDVGKLVSFDVTDSVGQLIPRGHPRWDLVVLGESHRQRELASLVRGLGPVDIFIHDSDHTYDQQHFEYATANASLKDDGILLSDDVDASSAFSDFAARSRGSAIYLLDEGKALGIWLQPRAAVNHVG